MKSFLELQESIFNEIYIIRCWLNEDSISMDISNGNGERWHYLFYFTFNKKDIRIVLFRKLKIKKGKDFTKACNELINWIFDKLNEIK